LSFLNLPYRNTKLTQFSKMDPKDKSVSGFGRR